MSIWIPKPKIISQNYPSQPILLYRGSTDIIDGEKVVEGRSLIQIAWYPFPRITIKFVYADKNKVNLSDEVELKLTELEPQYKIKVTSAGATYYGSGRNELYWNLKEPFRKGKIDKLSSIVFHIPNFFWFNICNTIDFKFDEQGNEIEVTREGWLNFNGQFVFDYGNWHIVLATLDEASKIEGKLDSQGGYGVTHICKIEHLDNTPFNLDEVYEVIDAFIYYLSFVRGFWLAPLLVSGFDKEGNQVLEEWCNFTIKADSWQSVGYCWTTGDSTEIVHYFPGFMEKWQDENWKEVIQNAIQWYVESYKHSIGSNTSVILIQAALEKLAWTYLSTNKCISSDGFQKLTFADRIKLFLKYLDIPLIDFNKGEISKCAKERNWTDTVVAVGEIRNLIVHPKINKKQRTLKVSETMINEVEVLGYHYLLQSLLKLFGYPYKYPYQI